MFLLKKIIAHLTMPLSLAFLLVIVGLILLMTKKTRTGLFCVVTSLLVVFLASWAPVADVLLKPLESRHAPVAKANNYPDVTAIVVLGTGYTPNTDLPITSQLTDTAIVRLMEGVRLYRQLPSAQLVLSGGSVYGSGSAAIGYAQAALAFGVARQDIALLDTPRDTAEEARAVRTLLGDKPFFLVTSASHMPRSVRHFQAAGLNPIPAPTRHKTLREDRSRSDYWVPSSQHLRKTERAIYEYLGLLAAGMGGE